MYSIAGYEKMTGDRVRMDAYAAALQAVVKPGAVVVDIGAGTGAMSLLACRMGAQKVFAIEPADAIHVARENAAANGLTDRIVFIQDLSANVTLPVRADVIVSDLRGVLPQLGHHIPSLIHARQNFLVPDGILIPHIDSLWVSTTAEPEKNERVSEAWDPSDWDLRLPAGVQYANNTMRRVRTDCKQLLTEPACVAVIDYRSVDSPDCSTHTDQLVTRDGRIDGLVVWFETTLVDGIGFSMAPGQPEAIYGRMLFPLSEPVNVRRNDHVSIRIRATLSSDEYIWQWNTQIHAGDATELVKADFRQSSFFAAPMSVTEIRKRAEGFVPSLGKNGRIDQFLLSEMSKKQSLDTIADHLLTRFPDAFDNRQAALFRARQLSERYSD